ncbi:hypothetical protein [uncultured Tateyamaria sp.]|nr:hypothetical protein [uncultured Tateyamaria sp.]
MQHDYFQGQVDTIYRQEQRAFAEMQERMQNCKRRQRRRRALMWVLRRL